jgi:hypothetical protein
VSDDASEQYGQTVCRLIDQIRPLLAGHRPGIQAAVLADLLAIFAVYKASSRILLGHDPSGAVTNR